MSIGCGNPFSVVMRLDQSFNGFGKLPRTVMRYGFSFEPLRDRHAAMVGADKHSYCDDESIID